MKTLLILGLLVLAAFASGCQTMTPAQSEAWKARIAEERRVEAAFQRALGDTWPGL